MMVAEDDITSWVKMYTKDLFSYAITKVPQKEIAEDLVQDTFLSAYQSYKTYQGKSNVKTWLFSIINHKIADYYRSKYKQDTQVTSDIIDKFFNQNKRWKSEYRPIYWGDEKELFNDSEFLKILKNCFDKLPQRWSAVVQLKFLEEHNSKLICSRLEITTSNFWQIIHRAKLQLRNCLEVKWFKR